MFLCVMSVYILNSGFFLGKFSFVDTVYYNQTNTW